MKSRMKGPYRKGVASALPLGSQAKEGEWSETKVGAPQGVVISPLLAKIYLHYVFDLWVEAWRRKSASGDVMMVRYVDDLVLGFEHRVEVERFPVEFGERVAKYGLELHPNKTRLIRFGRLARHHRQHRHERGEGEPETFTFLGNMQSTRMDHQRVQEPSQKANHTH